MFFFNRKIEVTVQENNSTKSRTFKELYTIFDVNKSNSSTPNQSKLQIYNLNEDSRSMCEKEDNIVIISAGYGTEVKQIYSGQIKKGNTQKKEVDNVTTMDLYDGINVYRNTILNKSFSENITGREILQYIINEMRITTASLLDVPDIKYNQGFAANGFAKDVLKTITKKMGLKWYIQDGELYIHGKNKTNGQTAFRLSYTTGLKQIPEKTENGYKLYCFLNPEFKVGRPIVIDADKVQGTYRINTINFKGDNEEGAFDAVIEVE